MLYKDIFHKKTLDIFKIWHSTGLRFFPLQWLWCSSMTDEDFYRLAYKYSFSGTMYKLHPFSTISTDSLSIHLRQTLTFLSLLTFLNLFLKLCLHPMWWACCLTGSDLYHMIYLFSRSLQWSRLSLTKGRQNSNLKKKFHSRIEN